MKVYILDDKDLSLERILLWLSENKEVKAVKVFDDYIRFLEKIENMPPAICIIRLGKAGIPGLKAAEMVHAVNPEIRIVFVAEDGEYALDAYEVGAYGYLVCPLDRVKFESCFDGNYSKKN